MDYLQQFQFWLKNAGDGEVRQQLLAMQNDNKAIENAFFKDLEFGTAGLRGIMGAGTNCLNVYTIIKTTQGIADCMKKYGQKTAAVTYDSRLNSQLFSETAARVFAKNGIRCFITAECQPTPFLSFIVRQLKCDIGINITASHNPQQYNGYKVYDGRGCQLTDEAANEMTEFIAKVNPFQVELKSFSQYKEEGLIQFVTADCERNYLNAVLHENLNCADGISVVYTPLNGAGYKMVPAVLKNVGVKKIDTVNVQAMPDGHFETCPYPNPEKREALTLALEVAKQKGSDIVIGTDPDCDRIGVAVLHGGEYIQLTGNEAGVLLTYYILNSLSQRKAIKKGSVVVKTIVTSALTDKIAGQFNVEVRDVLTGFKYIGTVIGSLEEKGEENKYIFGFEESCGYLKGTYVRDKDAVVAAMLVAEMCATYKKEGRTLIDVLNGLYETYGTYCHKTVSYAFEGASGAEVKQKLLDTVRKNGFATLAGEEVAASVDFLNQTQFDLPKADVLKYTTQQGTMLIVRPSGTEPLIKNYITVAGTPAENKIKLQKISAQLDKIFTV